MNDMSKSDADDYKSVCDERKYAFTGSNVFRKLESNSLSCQIMSLPRNTNTETLNYIISNTI